MKNNKIIVFLLVCINVLFLIYFFILAFYARPHYDDYHFLWRLRETGILNYVQDMYFIQTGRFVSTFLNGVIYKTILYTGTQSFIPVIFWLVGIFLTWIPFKALFKTTPVFVTINVVILFYNIFVLTNIDFPVFYWLCALSYYLLFPAIFSMIALINKRTLNIPEYILLVVLAVFISGSQETFTPVALFLLFVNLLFYFIPQGRGFLKAFQDTRVKRILIFMFLILVLYAVVIIAPGNYVRLTLDEFVKPSSLNDYLSGYYQSVTTFIYFQLFYLPYYLILVAVLVVLLKIPDPVSVYFNKKKYLFLASGIFVLYFLISVFPFVYLWSGFGIQRNYTPMVYSAILFISFAGIFLLKSQIKIMRIIAFAGLILLSLLMIINLYNDTSSAKKYAESVDERIAMVQMLQKQKQTEDVVVEAVKIPYTKDVKFIFSKYILGKDVPMSFLYYFSDTDTIPNEYAEHYSRVYDLDFLIKLDNNSDSK